MPPAAPQVRSDAPAGQAHAGAPAAVPRKTSPEPPPAPALRRFFAGLRCITALLCCLALTLDSPRHPLRSFILVAYGAWAVAVLWRETRGRGAPRLRLHGGIDVAWTVAMLRLTEPGHDLLALTFVQPLVMAGLAHGLRQAALLGVAAAAGLLIDPEAGGWPPISARHAGAAAAALGLAPAAELLARPLRRLRERLRLADRLGANTDPRRGLESLSLQLAQRLCLEMDARCAALVLPSADGALAVLAEPAQTAFRMGAAAHRQFETLLACLPEVPVSWQQRRRRADLVTLHGGGSPTHATAAAVAQLGVLLEADQLAVIPLRPLGPRRGHLLIGHLAQRRRPWSAAALMPIVPVLHRLLQQAALVDELQAEIAAHERARIGRDLHDSAIQPYLGLKYAVESLAVACPPDNPLQADLQSLAELVASEVGELRELISVLRTGEGGGDNALLPAVRRQARRFQRLFGIQVHLDTPDELPTSRALADAVFHMVNEGLNNVRKHTAARHVWVAVHRQQQGLHLTVRDDGGPTEPFVPLSLSQRTQELGGSLTVQPIPGQGNEIRIVVPIA